MGKTLKKQKVATGAVSVAVEEEETRGVSAQETEDSEKVENHESESDEENAESEGSEENDDSSSEGENSEGSSDSDSDLDDIIPKRQKKKRDDGAETFSTALNAILGSHLKAHDRDDPILVRQKKKVIKQKEDEKLELKARRLINIEKKQKYEKSRVKDLLPSAASANVRQQFEYERKLKKTAQRGVIKLFNAILSSQVQTKKELKDENLLSSKKEVLANDISKEKFLDMIKAAK